MGVELTPIAKPEYDYIAKTGTREGFVQPILDKPYEIELPLTLEELKANGVKYAVGASHWRVDYPDTPSRDASMNAVINECFRQQMWLACDKRVTILGHPWYNSRKLWFHDFSLIPRSMNLEIGAALKENKKYVECNSGYLFSPAVSEKYRMQYVEFIRELFEMGVPVTHGSDSHHQYLEHREKLEQCLKAVGFKDDEFSDIKEADFWG